MNEEPLPTLAEQVDAIAAHFLEKKPLQPDKLQQHFQLMTNEIEVFQRALEGLYKKPNQKEKTLVSESAEALQTLLGCVDDLREALSVRLDPNHHQNEEEFKGFCLDVVARAFAAESDLFRLQRETEDYLDDMVETSQEMA